MANMLGRLWEFSGKLPERAKDARGNFKQAWTRLYKVGSPFWTSKATRWVAVTHLVAIIVLLIANARMNVYISELANHYMTSIEQKDAAEVQRGFLLWYAGALTALVPISVYYAYFRTRLALVWRNWLSNSFFASYFTNLAYYKLVGNKELDNPDQRMAQDVDSFCNSSVNLFISIIDAGVNVYLWFGVLWAISGALTLTVVIYALALSIIVIVVGKALVKITNDQSKTEADLRATLQESAREAEAIAFYRGEPIARSQAVARLQAVIDTLMRMMWKYRDINMFTTFANGLVPLIAPFFIAPLYVSGQVKFGVITQAAIAVAGLFGALTLVVNQFGGIAGYTTIINRLGSLLEWLKGCTKDCQPSGSRIEFAEGPDLIFGNLTVSSPDTGHVYVKELNVVLKRGESMVIVGADGTGKTELLRTVAGIWNSGSGKVQRPAADQMMFLTQKPYLPPTTLRQAIGYPCADACNDDDQLLKVLKTVNLSELVTRTSGLDVVQNWHDLLSLSEQQRLSLARIIFKKPGYAIIDEASSALDQETERLVYEILGTLNTTIVSATNDDSLVTHHTWVLALPGDGTWRFCRAADYKPSSQN